MIKNETNIKSFWNGILVGGSMALIVLYIFGTKRGRLALQTLLQFSENLDTNIHKLHKHIQTSNIKNKGKEKDSFFETVSTIINKIKTVSKNT